MRPPNRAGAEVVQMPLPQAIMPHAFIALSTMPTMHNADWIAVDLPPATAEWEAVHDRLRRAAFSD